MSENLKRDLAWFIAAALLAALVLYSPGVRSRHAFAEGISGDSFRYEAVGWNFRTLALRMPKPWGVPCQQWVDTILFSQAKEMRESRQSFNRLGFTRLQCGSSVGVIPAE